MKYLFTLLILIHALIHLMGFIKAFQLAEFTNLTSTITKPTRLLWLFTTLLFLIALAGYFCDKSFWPLLAIIASILSQILIIQIWRDAKFGTMANILIVIVAIPAFAHYRFQQKIAEETTQLLLGVIPQTHTINDEHLQPLPLPVQRWLRKSDVIGKQIAYCARIQQSGRMRTSPDGNWMPFTATQYFDLTHPAFVWNATVRVLPLITMNGRDKFSNGEGEMLIKILSLIPVVNEGHNEKINNGTMLRYVGETIWFPSSVINPYIHWEPLDSLSAKAIFSYDHRTVKGIFRFNEEGDYVSFEAERYYGANESAALEKWIVTADDYKEINGVKVPYKYSVTWRLKEGDFTWLKLEITDLEINNPVLYD